jgi:hypothetical protein
MPKDIIKKIDALDHLSADELKRTLPATIEEFRAFGAGRLLQAHPNALAAIITALLTAGAAEVLTTTPAAAEALMDALWHGVEARAADTPDLIAALKKVDREIQVNIEASDSPLTGHFHVTKTGITGGAGLIHFRDQDYRYMGSTEILLQLLLGELPMGTSNLQLQTAGHSGFASRVGPVLRGVTALIKGVKN